MRIIAGEMKGRRLHTPKNSLVRPTLDQTKENLFNILQPLKEDALVLDLYSGTGNIGLEFLSRGAKCVHFNDLAKESIKTILKNIEMVGASDRSVVTQNYAHKKIKKAAEEGLKFDYIYIDPPFGREDVKRTLRNPLLCDILNANGLIITEQEKELDPIKGTPFLLIDARIQGNESLHFYRGANNEGDLPGEL